MSKKSFRKKARQAAARISEGTMFEEIRLWPNYSSVLSFEEIRQRYLGDFEEREILLIEQCYNYAQEVCREFPKRKNGEDSLVHPMNDMIYLAKAKADYISVCSGILHDVVEEIVERRAKGLRVKGRKARQRAISNLERRVELECGEKLRGICEATGTNQEEAEKIREVVMLMTRQKKHKYYRSISQIYHCRNPETRFRAILVKLGDRMHNIQTIDIMDTRDEDKKLESYKYQLGQCFKNIFILNNTERVLERADTGNFRYSLGKLFKKNGKATEVALSTIASRCLKDLEAKGLEEVAHSLRLGMYKFILEYNGLERVTKPSPERRHFADFYDGTIIKYDHKLHHDEQEFNKTMQREIESCRRMFGERQIDEKALTTAIYYKDAIALAQVVAHLLYNKGYHIKGFECSNLCSRNRICMRERG